MVGYRFKKKATRGDIARISCLLFCASSLGFLFTDFFLRNYDLSFWFVILFLENMVMTSYFALKGSIVDFTGAPRLPKGWIMSTLLEESDDRRQDLHDPGGDALHPFLETSRDGRMGP